FIVQGLRVGLPARCTHDLPDEKFEDAFVARAILRRVVGIFLDHFTAPAFDLTRVADLAEAFGRDDLRGRLARFQRPRECLLARRGIYFSALDLPDQRSKLGRLYGAFG